MMAEHRHLVEQGAELVELRLDFIHGGRVDLKRLLADRPCPVIATARREQDGGKWKGSEESRLLLLRTAVAEGVEYVDLEEDVAASFPRYGKTKRIVSQHDFKRTPKNLDEIHARLAALDADVVKIATMAERSEDVLRMLELMRKSEVATVGLCMGDIGTPSRILAGKYGAPFTYSTFHHERALAPGQLSFDQMKAIYGYDAINAETDVYGVIGDPIGHSLSPLIHNAAFRHLGMNKVYVPFRIEPRDLSDFLALAPEMGVRGLSITIPHKETAIQRMTKVDGAVRAVGAANTLVYKESELVGYNTDYRAAMDSLESGLEDAEAEGRSGGLKRKTVLMLGAGGVARAIAHGLARREAHVVIANRTMDRADELAGRVGGRAIEWSARHMIPADVIINCTSVGMHPNVDETPFDKHYLKPSMLVFDTVYNPENTLLVKDARSRNCSIVTGVDMFVRQAALQFELFTGEKAPASLMRETVKRATAAVKY